MSIYIVCNNSKRKSVTFLRNGGKMVYPDGTYGKGKCAYRGKIYEGVIEYKDNHLYVGGEFVKDMNL